MPTIGHDPGVAERALLKAVRDVLRSPTGGGYSDTECNIEFDELAPATVGSLYIVVMSGGWRPGPRHDTQAGVTDLVFGVDVSVVMRTRHVPRDRTRDAFLFQTENMSAHTGKVFTTLDWQYANVINAANVYIQADNGSAEGFIEPLRFTGLDKRPSIVPGELFNGAGDKAGLKRTLYFHGARRLAHKPGF